MLAKAIGWIEGWSRTNWKKRMRVTWIGHWEGKRFQYDRVVIVPFDDAVKLGIVKKDVLVTPS
jgi:hypothetical protein